MKKSSEANLVHLMRQFIPRYMRWACSKLPKNDVGYSRSVLLGVLESRGPVTMAELADELQVTRKNITTLIDGLEADGMVKRSSHPTDRRATIIVSTAKGKELGCTMQTDFVTSISGIFECLSANELAQLNNAVSKLVAELERRTESSTSAGEVIMKRPD
jgi:DNA-binding MarR family transcriptional regulator